MSRRKINVSPLARKLAVSALALAASCSTPPKVGNNPALDRITCLAAAVSPVSQYLNGEATRAIVAGDLDLIDALEQAGVAKQLVEEAKIDVAVCY